MFLETAEKLLGYCYACVPRCKPEVKKIQSSHLIAHRGAHDSRLQIRENTHEAFARARDLGCWGIEFDVHTTADGVIVVNHDPDLRRLWGKEAAIRETDFSELRKLAPQIPTLEEVVKTYGHLLHLFIELKAPFSGEVELARVLSSLHPVKDYHLISLDEPELDALTLFPRNALLLVAVHNNASKFCQLSLEKGYGGVLGHFLLLTKSRIRHLQEGGQCFGVGFVDSRSSLYREVKRNVTWLFTNRVGKVIKYI